MIITVATKNLHKLRELEEIAADNRLPVQLVLPAEAAEVEETGHSFFENALLKAQQTPPVPGSEWVLGEDSGLEVMALAGLHGHSTFPGLHSNRWMTPEIRKALLGIDSSEPANSDELNRGILALMKDQPNRRGQYVCHMVLYRPADKMAIHSRATTQLAVVPDQQERGAGGFGYDPIMLALEANSSKTMAELSPEEKNRISHRGRAFVDILSKFA